MLSNDIIRSLFHAEDTRQDTSQLEFYDTFEEKESVFGTYVRFESSTQFMYFINHELPKLLGDQQAVYRGLSSARYRLFNKAQRSFLANIKNNPKDGNAYHQAIMEMIGNARAVNKGVLPSFFKGCGLKDTHLSVLSFLQHYGSPTPFMDWTTDPFVALFFATAGMKEADVFRYHNEQVTYDLPDYLSLNVIVKDQALYQINEFRQLRATTTGSIDYDKLKKKKIQFIEEIYRGAKPSLSLLNNLHIVNQKGLFIYNNSSYLPLEEVFFDRWKGYYLMNKMSGRNTPRTPVICIDIHKSVVHWIRKQLVENGYTETSIYSKPEDIAKQSIPDIFKDN